MGKRGWLSAVKKAVISSYSKDKKGKKTHRSNSRKSRHGNQMMSFDTYSPQTEEEANTPMAMEVDQELLEQPDNHYVNQPSSIATDVVMAEEPTDLIQPEDEQMMMMQHDDEITHDDVTTAMEEEVEPADLKQPNDVQIMQPDSTTGDMVEEPTDVTQVDDEQIMQPDTIAEHDATAMEEEPTTTPPVDDVDDEVVPSTTQVSGKSKEEIAAIKIQTAYRGHMARKDWRVLRARRRLKIMIKGQAVKRQTAAAITCMQTMARIQSQVRSRTVQMAQVNKDLQRQLIQKTKKTLDRVKSSEKPAWNLSPKSKEQVEASLRKKREAAERREKALALIHTHQEVWRNSLKSANPTSTEPWGWNWLDRWNAVRPWEQATTNGGSVSSRSPTRSPPKKAVSKSASSKGSSYSMQSTRGSPNESLRYTSVAKKGSTKVGPKISTQASSRLVPVKKGGSSSKLGVRSIKKQSSLSGLTSVSRRSTVPRRTITI